LEFSKAYIVIFSVILCVICALAVSSVAVGLKEKQDVNMKLDRRINLLTVAGVLDADSPRDADSINTWFEDGRVEYVVFDRVTGEVVSDVAATIGVASAEEFEPVKWAKEHAGDADLVAPVPDEFKNTQVRALPRYLLAIVIDTETVDCLVLPIQGYGLWSTLKGFLAVERDLSSVIGITYYEHGETPGLGGEVDNPRWKGQFPGKSIYGASGELLLTVVKNGQVTNSKVQVDGIAGSTITSKGVDLMLRFWLSKHGYGPYLERQKAAA
jgi:Na+-transporting NADH:ubiquinone oxidoreductase subunit C